MATRNQEMPPGWGEDELTKFLDRARDNQLATFHNKRAAYGLMSEIDACFQKVGTNMLNPKDMLTPVFFYRCQTVVVE